jgi:hypothetical protein
MYAAVCCHRKASDLWYSPATGSLGVASRMALVWGIIRLRRSGGVTRRLIRCMPGRRATWVCASRMAGWGVDKDPSAAIWLCHRAAGWMYAPSMNKMGLRLGNLGRWVGRDLSAAVWWCRTATDLWCARRRATWVYAPRIEDGSVGTDPSAEVRSDRKVADFVA